MEVIKAKRRKGTQTSTDETSSQTRTQRNTRKTGRPKAAPEQGNKQKKDEGSTFDRIEEILSLANLSEASAKAGPIVKALEEIKNDRNIKSNGINVDFFIKIWSIFFPGEDIKQFAKELLSHPKTNDEKTKATDKDIPDSEPEIKHATILSDLVNNMIEKNKTKFIQSEIIKTFINCNFEILDKEEREEILNLYKYQVLEESLFESFINSEEGQDLVVNF